MFHEVIGSAGLNEETECVIYCRRDCRQFCSSACYWEDPVFVVQIVDQLELNQEIRI